MSKKELTFKNADIERLRENKFFEDNVVERCLLNMYELNILAKKFGVTLSRTPEFKYNMEYLFQRLEETSKYKFMNTIELIRKEII